MTGPRRPRTISLTRLSASRREHARVLEPHTDHERPKTRADCVGATRPCPFVGCKWHLALNVDTLAIKINFPTAGEPDEIDFETMPDTCVLDVADRKGDMTQQEVGERIGICQQRTQQIEEVALKKLRRRLEFLQVEDETPVPGRRHLAVVTEETQLHSPLPLKRPTNVTVLKELPVFNKPEAVALHLVGSPQEAKEETETVEEVVEGAAPSTPRQVLCANESCGLRFIPTGNNQRYCEACGVEHYVANKRKINRDKMKKNRQELRELRAAAKQSAAPSVAVPTPTPLSSAVAPLGSKKLTSIREEEVFTGLHEIFSQLGLTVTWAGLMEREPSGRRMAVYIVRPTAGDQIVWPMPDAMEDFEQFIPLLGYEWLGSTMALDPNAETWAIAIAFTPARLRQA